MNNIMHWTDRAISTWRNEGIVLRPGVSMTYIAEVEQVLGFTFPADLKELYVKIDGFEDNACTGNMFCLWSMETIYKEWLGGEYEDFIAFCDYLIYSHALGFRISDNGIYKSYDGTLMIAKSFSECIDLINSDSDLIY
jgi:hypothetical protein